MILLVDNYDSFTFNVHQALGSLPQLEGEEIRVVRNDAASAEDVVRWRPRAVILSPGPGHPRDAGLSLTLPDHLPDTPLLGVCLGHQALAHAAGGLVGRSERPTHGQTVSIEHDGGRPFRTLPSPFNAALYHSLVVLDEQLPETLEVAARTSHGDIMALRHRQRPHCGVQFHPESFMTEHGSRLLSDLLTW
ncbi:MAG: glutamine amidotransferase [Planctomycetota bacterium]|nr:MAG: glutamine amidotransferase [Planctomycetota bacterium]